jgi:hypothetical protein
MPSRSLAVTMLPVMTLRSTPRWNSPQQMRMPSSMLALSVLPVM